MKYLTIDGYIGGTGIRETYGKGYLTVEELTSNEAFKTKINHWLESYHRAFYEGYSDPNVSDDLDMEGKKIVLFLQKILIDAKVVYYSDAKMQHYY